MVQNDNEPHEVNRSIELREKCLQLKVSSVPINKRKSTILYGHKRKFALMS